jgi:outer membrane protein OmpA-like peptidoglycan-associated protein
MLRSTPLVPALAAILSFALASACATPPEPARLAARPLQPGPQDVVEVDHLLLVVDASASIPGDSLFLEEKTLVTAYVDSMPEGSYEAATVSFGGFERHRQRLSPFARNQVRAQVAETRHLNQGTPLHKVFKEEQETFAGRSGRAAVVIFTDGLVTDEFGRDLPAEQTLTAASEFAKAYNGTVCIHTVQLGEEVAGRELLRSLSDVTECGSFRTASATANEAALHAFQRDVFLAAKLPSVAAAPPSRCQGTPAGVPVDADGCWQIPAIGFSFDSAEIEASDQRELDAVAQTLRANPSTQLVIDGYTDTMGGPVYNQYLSLKRAQATKDALVSSGIDEDRIRVEGLGAENPLRANDSLDNRRANRRSELRIDR